MVLFPIISNKALFVIEAIAYLKYVVNSGGGAMGPSAPGGKIGHVPKKLEREKYFEG